MPRLATDALSLRRRSRRRNTHSFPEPSQKTLLAVSLALAAPLVVTLLRFYTTTQASPQTPPPSRRRGQRRNHRVAASTACGGGGRCSAARLAPAHGTVGPRRLQRSGRRTNASGCRRSALASPHRRGGSGGGRPARGWDKRSPLTLRHASGAAVTAAAPASATPPTRRPTDAGCRAPPRGREAAAAAPTADHAASVRRVPLAVMGAATRGAADRGRRGPHPPVPRGGGGAREMESRAPRR